MKKITRSIAASAAAVLLTAQALPANAVYQSSDEIAFALRAIETEGCGYIADGNNVYVSPSAAAAGTSVRIGMYIEAEYADLAFLYAKLQSDYDKITFNEESYHNPTAPYDEKSTYTLEDGTEFSTRLKPYCLGTINSAGYYQADSFGITDKFNPEENSMNLTWMYGYGESGSTSASFLGSRSDEFSFIEVELDIAPGTEAGNYTISFVTDVTDDSEMGATYLTSDDSENGESYYQHIVPTLKDLQIIIPNSEYFIMEHPTAYRWLDDTTPLSSEDFYPEGTQIYVDTRDGYVPQTLDTSKISSEILGETIQYLTDPDEFICGNSFEMYYDGKSFATPDSGDYVAFCEVRSGLRGDANMDGAVNANDAAAILVYAAERGAGGEPTLYSDEFESQEFAAYFLADVNEGSRNCGVSDGTSLNAIDASAILTYAAIAGSGGASDWNEILQ